MKCIATAVLILLFAIKGISQDRIFLGHPKIHERYGYNLDSLVIWDREKAISLHGFEEANKDGYFYHPMFYAFDAIYPKDGIFKDRKMTNYYDLFENYYDMADSKGYQKKFKGNVFKVNSKGQLVVFGKLSNGCFKDTVLLYCDSVSIWEVRDNGSFVPKEPIIFVFKGEFLWYAAVIADDGFGHQYAYKYSIESDNKMRFERKDTTQPWTLMYYRPEGSGTTDDDTTLDYFNSKNYIYQGDDYAIRKGFTKKQFLKDVHAKSYQHDFIKYFNFYTDDNDNIWGILLNSPMNNTGYLATGKVDTKGRPAFKLVSRNNRPIDWKVFDQFKPFKPPKARFENMQEFMGSAYPFQVE